jgi:hypothetical protein
VHHGLGLGGRAGGEQDPHGAQGVGVEGGDRRRVAEERLEVLELTGEVLGAHGLAGVVGGHRHPRQVGPGLGHERRVLGLGDGGHGPGVLDEVLDLRGHAADVGGDGDPAEAGHRVPGDDRLGAVVGMHQHGVALADPPGRQAPGEPPGGLGELGVGPGATAAVLGLPHEEGVVAAVLGTLVEQPRHVLAPELVAGDGLGIEARLGAGGVVCHGHGPPAVDGPLKIASV